MDFDFLNLGIPRINLKAGEELIDGKKWLVITWEDNGIGWSWDDMPEHVRKEYYRAKGIIEKMGGVFEYKARPGEGALITVKLPNFYKPFSTEALDVYIDKISSLLTKQ
ncbi:MAG: ATP-binding protein [Candidatus Omnitrophota bacterium]